MFPATASVQPQLVRQLPQASIPIPIPIPAFPLGDRQIIPIGQTEFGARFKAIAPEQVVSMLLKATSEPDPWKRAEAFAVAIQGLNLSIVDALKSVAASCSAPNLTFIDQCHSAIQYKAWLNGDLNKYMIKSWTLNTHLDPASHSIEKFNEAIAESPKRASTYRWCCCNCLSERETPGINLSQFHYDVHNKVPRAIGSILIGLANSIPSEASNALRTNFRINDNSAVKLVGAFLIEYFARPAHAALEQILNWLLENPNAIPTVDNKQFEAIFVLFRLTNKTTECTVGMNFGTDLTRELIQVMANLIVNGSMQMHTMLMRFARFTQVNYREEFDSWATRCCGVALYNNDFERKALFISLQSVYSNVEPQIPYLSREMQIKMQNIKIAINFKAVIDVS
jgi:hypothetical protein